MKTIKNVLNLFDDDRLINYIISKVLNITLPRCHHFETITCLFLGIAMGAVAASLAIIIAVIVVVCIMKK